MACHGQLIGDILPTQSQGLHWLIRLRHSLLHFRVGRAQERDLRMLMIGDTNDLAHVPIAEP